MKGQAKKPMLHPVKPSDVDLIAARIRASTMEERFALLVQAGIFTPDRRLTDRYRPLTEVKDLD